MKYRLILIAMVIGLLGFVSAYVYAQNGLTPTGTPDASSVIQQDIFVRGGPGRDYLPVGKLLAGDHVRPLSRNIQGDWVLIVYGKGFGWIRRDLAFWVENIDALPLMDVTNLTPSPVVPTTPSGTPLLLPTETPVGNWVQLNSEAQSGFVRAGPGRTYLRLGQLLTGDSVEPVSQNADGSWIMIRFGDGFGWIAQNLVHWVDNIDSLPVVAVDNLTPTATFTATNTLTATATATNTSTPTSTFTPTFTSTPSFIPTVTPSPTLTSTLRPTLTPTTLPSATVTATDVPTLTSTWRPTNTLIPTILPSATYTLTATSTATLPPTISPSVTPTLTATPVPTDTPTTAAQVVVVPSATIEISPTSFASPTSTFTSTPVPPTNTPQPSATSTVTATSTDTPIPPTQTPLPSATFTATATVVNVLPATNSPVVANSAATKTSLPATSTVTSTFTPTVSQTRNAASSVKGLTPTPNVPTNNAPPNNGVAPEVLIAGLVLIAILAYAVLYWRGLSGSERYTSGFVIEICPVCHHGHLIVESRQERLFGIPRARHSVRCTECRSVLREVSEGHWRYAVDPLENPDLYQRFNGQVVDDQTLSELAKDVSQTSSQRSISSQSAPPDFIDDDT